MDDLTIRVLLTILTALGLTPLAVPKVEKIINKLEEGIIKFLEEF